MSQKKVVLAAVLKPINDTRMFEKIGVTIASTNQYFVNIIGFEANTSGKYSNISFHPIFNFPRLSIQRFFCGFVFYKKLKEIAPQLIIITTHELLLPTIIYKLFHPSKVIYDVQENHFRNLLFTNSFPRIFRPILAYYVRAKEYLTAPYIDHFFLAEKYYSKEISFIKNKFTILENKSISSNYHPTTTVKKKTALKLLFSGTLAKSTGVFEAIKLTKRLNEIDPKISLTIIGYTTKPSTLRRIKKEIYNCTFIDLIGGNSLVNHLDILNKISTSNFGIICYPTNKSTINSTPTKLYEYLSNELPILFQSNSNWLDLGKQYDSYISVNFDNIDAHEILLQMKTLTFYPNGVGVDFMWKSEELKLINIISKITSTY